MIPGPCCPQGLTVKQVTRAMTNVTWPAATGARSYIASLKSPRGDAKCHTLNPHCLMGCITCGTNYTVSLDVISSTGKKSECRYHGFSSGKYRVFIDMRTRPFLHSCIILHCWSMHVIPILKNRSSEDGKNLWMSFLPRPQISRKHRLHSLWMRTIPWFIGSQVHSWEAS